MEISDGLKRSIETHDIVGARSSFYTIILSDPEFTTNRFDEAITYVKERGFTDIFDEHDGEELKNSNKWNETYFDFMASKLQDNFSEKRIQYLKEIARYLYTLKMTECKVYNSDNTENNNSGRKTSRKNIKVETAGDQTDYSPLLIIGIVLGAWFVLHKLFKGGK